MKLLGIYENYTKKNPLHSEVGIHVTGRRQLQDRSLPEDVFVLFTEEA